MTDVATQLRNAVEWAAKRYFKEFAVFNFPNNENQ